MDWNADIRLLGMKKKRRDAMKQMLDQAAERCARMENGGNPRFLIREKLNINHLTVEIARLNDEIFAMGQRIGVNPETGEIYVNAGREYVAKPG